MPDIVLSSFIDCSIQSTPCKVSIGIPNLQMRKLRQSRLHKLSRGHKAGNGSTHIPSQVPKSRKHAIYTTSLLMRHKLLSRSTLVQWLQLANGRRVLQETGAF